MIFDKNPTIINTLIQNFGINMRLIKSTCERIVKWYTERSQFTVMEWLFIVGVAGWLLFKLYELVLL